MALQRVSSSVLDIPVSERTPGDILIPASAYHPGIVLLDPDDVILDTATHVRTDSNFPSDDSIKQLAQSIKSQGQLEPGVVRLGRGSADGEMVYHLIAGRRRLAACASINRKFIAHVIETDDPFRAAVTENLQRKNFTPIELSHVITRIRDKYDWKDGADTKEVAKFLNVSPATVTQHEKLRDLSADLQAKVHEGVLSAQSAFELAKVAPAKREEVVEKAQRIAKAEAPAPKKTETKSETVKPVKVTAAHVKKAIRTTPNASDKPTAPTRSELVEFFRGESGPAYPKVMSEFARYFAEEFASGKGGERGLVTRWTQIASEIEGKPFNKTERKVDAALVKAGVRKPAGKKPHPAKKHHKTVVSKTSKK